MDEEKKLKLARAITDQLPAPEEIRDDWGTFIIDTVLPEGVWSRPGLSQRDRSLITVAALTALYRPNELRLHVGRPWITDCRVPRSRNSLCTWQSMVAFPSRSRACT